MLAAGEADIEILHEQPPAAGKVIKVADGLLWGRLPLYIVAIYPMMATVAFDVVRSLGVFRRYGTLVGAVCVGFVHHAFYEIFDQLGPQLKWWGWNDDNQIVNHPSLASVPMTSMLLFAAVSFGVMTFLVVKLVGSKTDGDGPRRGWSLTWRIVLAGVLAPPAMALFGIPSSIFGGDTPNVTAQAWVLGIELGLIWIAGAWILLTQSRHHEGEPMTPFARIYPAAWFLVFAVFWLASLPGFLDARDGITSDGTPIGSGLYTIACFVAASARWLARAAGEAGARISLDAPVARVELAPRGAVAHLEDGRRYAGRRVIRTALRLEQAARIDAETPIPPVILENLGPDMTETQISDLLSAWRKARQGSGGGVGYLNQSLKANTLGWSSADRQLVEGRRYVAVEVARLMSLDAADLDAAMSGSSVTYQNTVSQVRNRLQRLAGVTRVGDRPPGRVGLLAAEPLAHVGVVGEATGGQQHTLAGADTDRCAIAHRPDPDHAAVLHHQLVDGGLGPHRDVLRQRDRQSFQQMPALALLVDWVFERLWTEAVELGGAEHPWDSILELMDSGMTMEAASGALGIAPRTGRRRIADAMQHYGASSLFALGGAWSSHR